MRIVFMGTPSIAVGTLEALLKADHEVVGVFTQPDKPVGRKQILTPPPVKVFAEENGITVYQPRTVKDGEALLTLKDLNPDIIVVVAYGKILPKHTLFFIFLSYQSSHKIISKIRFTHTAISFLLISPLSYAGLSLPCSITFIRMSLPALTSL